MYNLLEKLLKFYEYTTLVCRREICGFRPSLKNSTYKCEKSNYPRIPGICPLCPHPAPYATLLPDPPLPFELYLQLKFYQTSKYIRHNRNKPGPAPGICHGGCTTFLHDRFVTLRMALCFVRLDVVYMLFRCISKIFFGGDKFKKIDDNYFSRLKFISKFCIHVHTGHPKFLL